MGFVVHDYDLNSLREFSGSYFSMSSIFSVVPLSTWDKNSLTEFSNWFILNDEDLSDFGTIILDHFNKGILGDIRENNRYLNRQNKGVSSSLNDQKCNTDFLKLLSNNNLSLKESKYHLAIMSSLFPEPGWILLVEPPNGQISKDFMRELKELLKTSLNEYFDINDKEILKKASDLIKKISEIEIQIPELVKHRQRKKSIEDALGQLDLLKSKKEKWDGSDNNFLYEYMKSYDKIEPCWLDFLNAAPEHKKKLAESLKKDHALLKILIYEFVDNKPSGKREEILAKKGVAFLIGQKGEIKKEIKSLLERTVTQLRHLLEECNVLNLNFDSSVESNMEMTIRELSAQIEKTHELRYYKTPKFLCDLEIRAKKKNITTSCLPYDHPRMIGWKLAYHKIKYNYKDFKKVFPESQKTVHVSDKRTKANDKYENYKKKPDGSVFSDFVNLMKIERKDDSLRKICMDMLNRFLGEREINNLSKKLKAEGDDIIERLDNIFKKLGWEPENVPSVVYPLIYFENSENCKHAEYNDLRKSLESFFKDLILLIQSQYHIHILGKFRRDNQGIDFQNNKIMKLNYSGLKIILEEYLNSLAFDSAEVSEFMESVDLLKPYLNRGSHDNIVPLVMEPRSISNRVSHMIRCSQKWFGELPWHFTQENVYGGDFSKIISGRGWRHDHPEKWLQILDMFNESKYGSSIVWNRTGINPVISSPVFLF